MGDMNPCADPWEPQGVGSLAAAAGLHAQQQQHADAPDVAAALLQTLTAQAALQQQQNQLQMHMLQQQLGANLFGQAGGLGHAAPLQQRHFGGAAPGGHGGVMQELSTLHLLQQQARLAQLQRLTAAQALLQQQPQRALPPTCAPQLPGLQDADRTESEEHGIRKGSRVRAANGEGRTHSDFRGKPGTWLLMAGHVAVVAEADEALGRIRLRNSLGKVSDWLPASEFRPVGEDGAFLDTPETPPASGARESETGDGSAQRAAGSTSALTSPPLSAAASGQQAPTDSDRLSPQTPQQPVSPPEQDGSELLRMLLQAQQASDAADGVRLRVSGADGIDVRHLAGLPTCFPQQQQLRMLPPQLAASAGVNSLLAPIEPEHRRGKRSPRRRWAGPPTDKDGLVDPNTINFSQSSIAPTFANGRHKGQTLRRSLEQLRDGTLTVHDLPVISVFEEKGQWYSANNRRLWVFRKFGKPIPVNPGPRGNAPLTALPGQEPTMRWTRQAGPADNCA